MMPRPSFGKTFLVFLRLGVTSFGGPVAHLGYFHEEFVRRLKWLDQHTFTDMVALAQFLPGPASSQVGLAIGLHRAGWRGALAAWLGFTLPSALLMTAFAYGMDRLGDLTHAGWLAGLKLAAVAVVAQAVVSMARKFCVDLARVGIAMAGTVAVLAWSSGLAQVVVIASGALIGWLCFGGKKSPAAAHSRGKDDLHVPYDARGGAVMLALFAVLLVGLPLLRLAAPDPAIAIFDHFYRAGALVFGGGHVVLPLLHAAVVDPGWVDNNKFLAGYAAAQALPGPLFTFAAYLGAVLKPWPHGVAGAAWCLLAIYTPAVLLMLGALPFWVSLRRKSFAQAILKGANAAVVGLLFAALIRPVGSSALHGPLDCLIALGAYLLLVPGKAPPWLVVITAAGAGAIFLR